MNDPPSIEDQSLSEPVTTVRPAQVGRNAGAVSLQSGYALPARHHPRVLILIDAGFSSCLSRGSATLITSNLPFDEWTETFGTERLTGALLDRLTHHVNILEMNGESYRLAQSQARKATKTA